MSAIPIPIEKKEFIQVLEATGFTIDITNMELNKSANLLISFYGKTGLIKTDCLSLVQPDYNDWTNDEWLVGYVARKFGLTLI